MSQWRAAVAVAAAVAVLEELSHTRVNGLHMSGQGRRTGDGRARTTLMQHDKVAVCVSGQLRTWDTYEVQHRLYNNFHHEGYEYFFSIDDNLTLVNVTPGIRNAIRNVHVGIGNPADSADKACPKGTAGHNFMYLAMSRLSACFDGITQEEETKHFLYSYIIRARPDIAFDAPLPHASTMVQWADQYHRDLLLCDDLFAVAPRTKARNLLLYPTWAYSECHNATRWSWACGFKVESSDLKPPYKWYLHQRLPCCPMDMISWYDSSLVWNMAWPLYVDHQYDVSSSRQTAISAGGPIPPCTIGLIRPGGEKFCASRTCR